MNWGNRTLFDDPVVAAWDAAQSGTSPISDQVDESDVALIEAFLALDVIPGPSAHFQEALGRRLEGMSLGYPVPDRQATVSTDSCKPSRRWSVIPSVRDGGMRSHRWMRLPLAAAVLALLTVAGLLVLYRAVPTPSDAPAIPVTIVSKPELQNVVQFDFDSPLWGMPDATTWTHMEFGLLEFAPGASFTTDQDWYTCVHGPLMLRVVSGELAVQPAGSALSFFAGRENGPPVDVSAGTLVSMKPDDTLVFSAVDTASGSNPGSEPALALYGLVGPPGDDSNWNCGNPPTDAQLVNLDYSDSIAPLSSLGASVSLQRLELKPFDSFVFEPGATWRYLTMLDPDRIDGLRLFNGVVDPLSQTVDSQPLYISAQALFPDIPGTGPRTLVNIGEEPVDIYFLVIEPYPGSATPTP